MYDTIELSKYIVTKCFKDSQPVNNIRLQQILYCIKKAFIQQGRLIFGDDFEAWDVGPVIPNVYYYFGGYGAMPICDVYTYKQPDVKDLETINNITDKIRNAEPWDACKETNKKGGAWHTAHENKTRYQNIIPNDLIKELG